MTRAKTEIVADTRDEPRAREFATRQRTRLLQPAFYEKTVAQSDWCRRKAGFRQSVCARQFALAFGTETGEFHQPSAFRRSQQIFAALLLRPHRRPFSFVAEPHLAPCAAAEILNGRNRWAGQIFHPIGETPAPRSVECPILELDDMERRTLPPGKL